MNGVWRFSTNTGVLAQRTSETARVLKPLNPRNCAP
jgi:hypothetical protein